ncbi:alpha/beta hydrolase [Stenotrophomonas maltophilia]|jgi:acetyl esterase/lipase|uniref:alpha/beta hydrolase n=1 Tax=Stenotrophomonas TaxID=40323 RepID=UPI0002B8C3E5|nr:MULTISPECIES: alpha/beta hydrolase [Stenotrophomonas]EKT2104030.1 alpha/beta hydrolase [Stenotrophomonas maltophilia]EMF60636.1 Esterase/lipase [Stenotrophomonas maltophilia EPM1]KWV53901.1 esterase [Stenotrophomonas maltophilia]MBA0278147.1 alpha/beta hydrolase [Stenotrophomonas maltophilia]MBA0330771.1 alpha/beta hydrolase [Stenotrophomonas maltophilia]
MSLHAGKLRGLAVLLILLNPLLAGAVPAAPPALAPEVVPLWPQDHWQQRARGPERTGVEGSAKGAVSGISDARMEIYRPLKPNGTAVVIFGGGGYFRIQIGSAAKPTAQWLQSLGVTAAVVYYRLPADGWAPVSPFQDGQRAMRLLRAQAASLRVDPERIGALGFSAGGNLAGIVATRFDAPLYPPVDAADQLSARPDFLGMIYPVVSMRAPLDHTRSKRELASQGDAQQAYSVEQHVRKDMPPVFLAQAVDDRTVDVGHSVAMYQATHAAGIPVELHLFEAGGHSWGLGKPGTLVAQWPRLFANWARSHGYLGPPLARLQPHDASAIPAAAAQLDDDGAGD